MTLATQTFEILAPSCAPLVVGGGILLVWLGLFGFFAYVLLGMKKASFSVEGGSLHIKTPLYGRAIPKSALKLAEARVVNLGDAPELKPVLRIGGMSFAGVKLGRFRLKSGDTAMLYTTGSGKSLVIPTSENYTLVLETPHADELLSTLKSA